MSQNGKSAEKRPRGRPRKVGVTQTVNLEVDEATCIKLDELIRYGGYGTSRTEIVMFMLRLWLRDNHTQIMSDIAAKHSPFGANGTKSTE